MTDPISPDSPTTNEQLGVVGAQAAAAEQQATGANTPRAATPEQVRGFSLRHEALVLANKIGGAPSAVVARAKAYENYLKESSDG